MLTRFAALTLLAAALATSAGCYSFAGVPRSKDAFFYESQPNLPATISVIDSRDGSVVWSIDVPVGKKLGLRFYDDRKANGSSETRPAMMRWQVINLDDGGGSLDNEEAVPLASARKIEYELRSIPEYDDGGRVQPRSNPVRSTVSPAGTRSSNSRPARTGNNSGAPRLDPVRADD